MTSFHPWMVVIAGPNGAGKSTFYNMIMQEDPLFRTVPFINMDNYAKEFSGSSNPDEQYIFEAGRRVRKEMDEKFNRRENFIYETTGSGRSHLKMMDKAKTLGYDIATIFIGLNNVELSHLRVQSRVQNGGHDVPPKTIERRYPRIVKGLPEMLKRSDIAAVFDNSSKNPYKLVFFMDDKTIKTNGCYPDWVKEGLSGRKTSKEISRLSPEIIKKLKDEQKEIARKIFSRKNIGRQD